MYPPPQELIYPDSLWLVDGYMNVCNASLSRRTDSQEGIASSIDSVISRPRRCSCTSKHLCSEDGHDCEVLLRLYRVLDIELPVVNVVHMHM